jgi:NAD(P)-dependent dehydrogenase (short-subunit alcohol dehydrogenase family)
MRRSFPRRTRNVLLINGDVGEEETAAGAVASLIERFGRLDALVSNAGIMIRKPLRQLTLAEWHHAIDTNLTATFLFARAAERELRKTHGAIVTIASTRALMSEANTETYSASKAGIVALTHALAISLGPDIRVNCISPGWIETKNYSALRRKDHAQHPMGRVGIDVVPQPSASIDTAWPRRSSLRQADLIWFGGIDAVQLVARTIQLDCVTVYDGHIACPAHAEYGRCNPRTDDTGAYAQKHADHICLSHNGSFSSCSNTIRSSARSSF